MEQLIKFLAEFMAPRRFELFCRNAALRTRYLTVVLEDIYQPHNASAVLRTCDCLGIQNVNIIENRNRYQINPQVVMGSTKWLDIRKFNGSEHNTENAIRSLKSEGYRIVAATPHVDDVTPERFDLSRGKAALMFGTELTGLSDIALGLADEFIRIPMYGFTESFNISVSAAIIAQTLIEELRRSDLPWQLTESEQNELILNWLRKSIKDARKLEKKFNFDELNKEPCQ